MRQPRTSPRTGTGPYAGSPAAVLAISPGCAGCPPRHRTPAPRRGRTRSSAAACASRRTLSAFQRRPIELARDLRRRGAKLSPVEKPLRRTPRSRGSPTRVACRARELGAAGWASAAPKRNGPPGCPGGRSALKSGLPTLEELATPGQTRMTDSCRLLVRSNQTSDLLALSGKPCTADQGLHRG